MFAAVALLLQLALTSAHVHVGDGHDIPTTVGTSADVATANTTGAPTHDHGDEDRAHGLCLICTNIHLAGTGQLPDAPAINATTLSKAGARMLVHRDSAAPAVSLAFRSRAPPLT